MRILVGIGVSMVHAMHDPVGPGTHIRGALCDIGKDKEKPFPGPAHGKGAVGGVAVLKKSLGKQRQVPMGDKKDNNKNQNIKYQG